MLGVGASIWSPIVLGAGAAPLAGFTLDMNFAGGSYLGATPSNLTVVRAQTVTSYAETSTGTYLPFAANTPRITDKGLLIEELRTNPIRNNTMVGGSPGSPGTTPTNWQLPGAVTDGLTRSIEKIDIENGVQYIDMRFVGTIIAGGGTIIIAPETQTQIIAADTQVWTQSTFLKLVSGSFNGVASLVIANTTFQVDGTSVVQNLLSSDLRASIDGTLRRFTLTSTLAGASTNFIHPRPIRFVIGTAGQAVDFTIRIGWPQLELGSWATSPIPTTTVVATRQADQISLTGSLFTAAYNESAATMYAEGMFLSPVTHAITENLGFVSNGSGTNRFGFFRAATNNDTNYRVVSGGTSYNPTADIGALPPNVIHRVAMAASVALGASATTNSDPVNTAAVAAMPVAPDRLCFGMQAGSIEQMNGWLRRLSLARTRISDAGLVAITTPPSIFSLATFDMDFVNSTYRGVIPDQLTVTRATPPLAYAPNAAGVYSSFAANTPRITDLGLLAEEARTNSIRNNSFQGTATGIIGTGGNPGTNWSVGGDFGICTVKPVGTLNGVEYVDLEINGVGAAGFLTIFPDGNTAVIAGNNTTLSVWTESVFIQIVSGSVANVTSSTLNLRQKDSGGVNLGDITSSILAELTGTFHRVSATLTATNASTAFVCPVLALNYVGGASLNFTLRIGWPQLELGAFVTSPIRTTSVAQTRTRDEVKLLGNAMSWYQQSTGTVYAQWRIVADANNTNHFFYGLSDGLAVGTNEIGAYSNESVTPASWNTLVNNASAGQTNLFGVSMGPRFSRHRMARSFFLNSFNVSVDGSISTRDLSGTPPVGIDRMQLGGRTDNTFPLNGFLERIAYTPVPLGDGFLTILTTPTAAELEALTTLAMNFTTGVYKGATPADLTITRNNPPTTYALNAAGTYLPFAANTLRITDLGLLIEEGRTNSIRNNSMQGAVVGVIGSGGVIPTNWVISANGAVPSITAIEPFNGVDTLVASVSGTVATNTPYINFEPLTTGAPAASVGQTWTGSVFVHGISGHTFNMSLVIYPLDSGGAPIAGGALVKNIPLASLGAWQRVVSTYASLPVGTTYIAMRIAWSIPDSTTLAVPVVTRIGWPQLEQGGNATSPLRTTGTTVTRNADFISLPLGALFESLWNDALGTLYGEAVPISVPIAAPSRRFVEVTASTINDRFFIGVSAGDQGRGFIANGGASQADLQFATTTPNVVNKIAMAWQSADAQAACNGVLSTQDTSVTVPLVDRMTLGSDLAATAGAALDGYLRSITYAPARFPNAVIQALTNP